MILPSEPIIHYLLLYKYFVLFPVMIVEGPAITVIAGFLCSLGYLNIFAVYGVVVMGDIVGDSIYYVAGRWGKKRFLDRWGRYIGVTMKRIMRLQEHFAKHTGKTLIAGKLSHAFGAPVLVAAGVANVSYWQFVLFNFMATLPKSLILLLIGFYFGQGFSKISKYLDYTAFAMIALAALIVTLHFIMKRILKNFPDKA